VIPESETIQPVILVSVSDSTKACQLAHFFLLFCEIYPINMREMCRTPNGKFVP
jgi:hypothetical protein